MAYTAVSDVIVPSVFVPYVIERSAELSELVTSGIIDTDPTFAGLAGAGGQTVNMPFWLDLSGDDQVIDDINPLVTKKIGASSDVAVIHNRGDAWKTNDLAGLLAGSDPQNAIGDLVASYWARKTQAWALATLHGIFAHANVLMDGNLSAIHATAGAIDPEIHSLNGLTFINAAQKLGDSKDQLVAIIMHSAVEASLLARDLITFMPDSLGKPTLKTFQGKRVIIDDGMPVEVINSANVYTSYLFGRGALALGVSRVGGGPIEGGVGTWEVEFAREALAGNSIMINRRRFILHPRGVKWLGGTMAGKSPTNAELRNPNPTGTAPTGPNWLRVYEAKHIRVVKITHNIELPA